MGILDGAANAAKDAISGGGGGGGGNLLGEALNIGASFGLSELTGSQQLGSAKQVRRFSKQQRATAYQVAVNDLKNAGLNPILAALNSPLQGGSAAQAQVPDYARAFNSARQTSIQNKQANANIEHIKADIGLKNNQSRNTDLVNKRLGLELNAQRTQAEFDQSWLGKRAIETKRGTEFLRNIVPGVGVMVGAGRRASSARNIRNIRRQPNVGRGPQDFQRNIKGRPDYITVTPKRYTQPQEGYR